MWERRDTLHWLVWLTHVTLSTNILFRTSSQRKLLPFPPFSFASSSSSLLGNITAIRVPPTKKKIIENVSHLLSSLLNIFKASIFLAHFSSLLQCPSHVSPSLSAALVVRYTHTCSFVFGFFWVSLMIFCLFGCWENKKADFFCFWGWQFKNNKWVIW